MTFLETFLENLPILLVLHVLVSMLLLVIFVLDDRLLGVRRARLIVLHDGTEDN